MAILSAQETVPARTVLGMLRPHRSWLIAAAIAGLTSAALSLAQPLAVGNLVGSLAGSRPTTGPVLLLVAMFAGSTVMGTIEMYLLGRCGAAVAIDHRRSIVSALLRAPLGAHLARKRGDMLVGATSDTTLVQIELIGGLRDVLINLVLVTGGIVLMSMIDARMTVVTVGCLAFSAVAGVLIARRFRKAMRDSRTAMGNFGAALQRALTAVSTVKLCTAEERERIASPSPRTTPTGPTCVLCD